LFLARAGKFFVALSGANVDAGFFELLGLCRRVTVVVPTTKGLP